jgi:hypothetical protein
MQLVSLIWGILAVIGMGVAFIPCLGALNWLVIPFAVIGLIIGIVALAQAPPANRGQAVAGTVCSAIAVVLGCVRLVLGGGIL